ncbi:MAG: hypothetical protein HXX14_14535 [Bacteroidetes bacterium]|nr:hypothetical protein [Bacteroidota bacterium]
MKFEERIINCRGIYPDTNRTLPFRVGVYTFNYETVEQDKSLIDQIIADATTLANKVNPGAANNAYLQRSYDRILNNCIAGVLSEYLWRKYLNSVNEKVCETECTDVSAQIDLQIISNKKKIEVRSSFPRNGIDFAICSPRYEFDIIGMYSNGYKPGEIQKNNEKFIDKIKKNGFEAFLTGGGTWNMMIDNKISIEKSFVPDDEIDLQMEKTSYRVIPFSRALDTRQIYDLVYNEK